MIRIVVLLLDLKGGGVCWRSAVVERLEEELVDEMDLALEKRPLIYSFFFLLTTDFAHSLSHSMFNELSMFTFLHFPRLRHYTP